MGWADVAVGVALLGIFMLILAAPSLPWFKDDD